MEKISPFHHPNPPFLQTPFTIHRPKTHSSISCVLGVVDPTPETLISISLPSISYPNQPNSLNSLKQIHTQIIKFPKKANSNPVGKFLITSYLEFGDFRSASTFFFMGFDRNYLLWNDFLEEFKSFGGNPYNVLVVFNELCGIGVSFDSRVLTIILKICVKLMNSWLGLEVHASAIKRGFDVDAYLMCAVMSFYGRCWGIEKADKVFDETPVRGVLLWNETIVENLRHQRPVKALKLFRDMQFSLVKAKGLTISRVLQVCGNLNAFNEGKQIHGYVLRLGLEYNVAISNSLISMYSKYDKLEQARIIFDSMDDRNISSWNSIISAYATAGYFDRAWSLFREMENFDIEPEIVTWNCLISGHFLHGLYHEVFIILRRMQEAGFKPNSSSISSVLQAISELRFLKPGKEIHGHMLRNGLDYDVYVGTSLLDMYVKNEELVKARAVFDNMENKNIFAWNSLISGYSFKGHFEEAVTLLNRMEKDCIKPDLVTWNGLLFGYSMWGLSKEAIHAIHQIKASGLAPNVISWTALISGCSQNMHYKESLEFFAQMQQEGVEPNSATVSSLLRACSGLSLLQKGEEIHCHCIRNGFIEDVYVSTALVDMYSKSGSIKNARNVFRSIKKKTLASWNCMIMGFGIYGHGEEALSLFDEMRDTGFVPDAITFTALLSSCKHSGLIDEAWKLFDKMRIEYSMSPTIEHYSCMVDLLGRIGYVDEAWDFIQGMPFDPDATIWGALLLSCKIHKNLELAEIAAKKLFELEPYNSANYVLMMGLYAILNRWEDVECVRESMTVAGLKTGYTWSWIRIDGSIHVFSDDEKAHPDAGEIYFELYQLVFEMKKYGYVPDINCVYQKIDDQEKEKVLLSHTEKLAITYGLLKMKNSEPIRVIKNSRVCSDCHAAAKLTSLIRNREIFLKDGVRFHHFQNGKCSCNDCW